MNKLLKSYVSLFREVGAFLKVTLASNNHYSITVDAGDRGKCGLVALTSDTTFILEYLNRKLKALKEE